jgi:hypothetical protein
LPSFKSQTLYQWLLKTLMFHYLLKVRPKYESLSNTLLVIKYCWWIHRHLSNIDCLSFVMYPLLAQLIIGFFSFFFLLHPLTVLMKQTRQAVSAIKQSIFLRCLWVHSTKNVSKYIIFTASFAKPGSQ